MCSIAVIDYHKGNIRSVVRGLEACGADVEVCDSPGCLDRARAIVLPGVGAFKDAMDSLDELDITKPLIKLLNSGMPFLGICLGLHVLFEGGTEHAENNVPRDGLGVLKGIVDAMPKEAVDVNGQIQHFKVPHVGWNTVETCEAAQENVADKPQEQQIVADCTSSLFSPENIFSGIDEGSFFYFTHSYIAPESPFTVAKTTHSVTFPSAVRYGNVWGVQFHPEKSSSIGARFLENFVHAANDLSNTRLF